MSDKIEFKSAIELYNRVLPALYSKVKELKGLGYKYINEKDVWNYLVANNWKNKRDLQLSDLISDILYCDNNKLNDYVANEKNDTNKDIDEEIL
jgi:hypothetical protein